MGITQVLFSMAVIELSKPGLEATTYELLITVANASGTVSIIIATQLLAPLNATGCTDDGPCPSSSVNVNSQSGFNATDGPYRYTIYCIVVSSVSVGCCLLFTQFLPASKEQCLEWKIEGEKAGASNKRGMISIIISVIVVLVSIILCLKLYHVHYEFHISMDSWWLCFY